MLPEEPMACYVCQPEDAQLCVGLRGAPGGDATAPSNDRSPTLDLQAAFTAQMDRRTILDLDEGLQLRRARGMGVNRIELSGFSDAMRERLTAYGLFHEIISWKLRMFVPVDAGGVAVLDRVMKRWPIQRVGDRAAA